MLKHWAACQHTHFHIGVYQLMKADKKTPVTNKVEERDILSAIPGLYQKLCTEVHRFPNLGGADEKEVIIPKAIGCFNDVDRVALANLIESFHWPYSVGEDYDVSGL